jgi:hypothetical protein
MGLTVVEEITGINQKRDREMLELSTSSRKCSTYSRSRYPNTVWSWVQLRALRALEQVKIFLVKVLKDGDLFDTGSQG